MRVVHVLAEFSGNEGMGRCVTEIAKRATSVESIVITNRKGPVVGDVEVLEVGGGSELFHLTRRGAIESLIQRLKPGLVHLHGGIFVSLLAMSPAFRHHALILSLYAWPSLPSLTDVWESSLRGLSSKAVLSLRVAVSGMLPAAIVRRALDRPQLKGIITQDPTLQERLGRLTRTPVHWIRSGADVDETRATFSSSQPVVVSAGRAELSRGFDLLLRAAQHMNVRLKALLLPGRETYKIRNLARQLRIAERLEIHEGVANDLRREMSTGTVAAFPFRYDYTTIAPPLTVMEAMSVGLPVIGTDVACMSPILEDGVNGLVVPKEDCVALSDAIGRLTTDPRLWQELSDGAVDTIRRWNWPSSVDAVSKVYDLASRCGAGV